MSQISCHAHATHATRRRVTPVTSPVHDLRRPLTRAERGMKTGASGMAGDCGQPKRGECGMRPLLMPRRGTALIRALLVQCSMSPTEPKTACGRPQQAPVISPIRQVIECAAHRDKRGPHSACNRCYRCRCRPHASLTRYAVDPRPSFGSTQPIGLDHPARRAAVKATPRNHFESGAPELDTQLGKNLICG